MWSLAHCLSGSSQWYHWRSVAEISRQTYWRMDYRKPHGSIILSTMYFTNCWHRNLAYCSLYVTTPGKNEWRHDQTLPEKKRTRKTWHQIARVENAGVEKEGVECVNRWAGELRDKCTWVGIIRKRPPNSSSKEKSIMCLLLNDPWILTVSRFPVPCFQ